MESFWGELRQTRTSTGHSAACALFFSLSDRSSVDQETGGGLLSAASGAHPSHKLVGNVRDTRLRRSPPRFLVRDSISVGESPYRNWSS